MSHNYPNPHNQFIALADGLGNEWLQRLPYLLEMRTERNGNEGCIKLLFINEYFVLKANNLQSLWDDLVNASPHLATKNYGLTSIVRRAYQILPL